MPKMLLIVRHAKSSWANEGLTDFQRPLNERGLRVAPQVAQFVRAVGIVPDLIVCSAAKRAQSTAQIFAQELDIGEDRVMPLEELYCAPASIYCQVMSRFVEESVSTLMLVGHNPGLESLVQKATGTWEPMPTCAVASIELDDRPWPQIATLEDARLNQVWRPKEIGIR